VVREFLLFEAFKKTPFLLSPQNGIASFVSLRRYPAFGDVPEYINLLGMFKNVSKGF